MNFIKFYTEQLGKGKTIEDIAKKHSVKSNVIKKELKKGVKVEKEHTKSAKKAKSIAKDHLVEKPKYYTKLKKAGL